MNTEVSQMVEVKSNSDSRASLVEKIIQKTREGKIQWERTATAHEGLSQDGSMSIKLQPSNSIFGEGGWSSFIVNMRGKDILRMENSGASFLALAGGRPARSTQLISELLHLLEEARLKLVRDAIADLDRL